MKIFYFSKFFTGVTIASYLNKRKGIETIILTDGLNPNSREILEKNRMKYYELLRMNDELDYSSIEEKEFWNAYYTSLYKLRIFGMDKFDEKPSKIPRNFISKFEHIAKRYYLLIKKIFKKEKPDLLVFGDGGQIYRMAALMLAKELNIPFLYFNAETFIKNRLYIDKCEMANSWIKKEYYQKKPTREERKRVKKYLGEWKKEKTVVCGKPPARNLLQRIVVHFHRISKYFREGKIDADTAYIPLISEIAMLKRNLRFYITPLLYDKIDLNKKYFFFPLHEPQDTQITLREPEFIDQSKVVKKIALNLPEGYFLYAKPHPRGLGRYPFKWIREFKKLKNVRFVSHNISSHDLIKNSQGVIVINSSVGFESLLYEKPVLALGSPPYAFEDLVIKNKNLKNLKKDINLLLSTKIPKEKVIRLVNAAYKSSYPCSLHTERSYVHKEENITEVGNAILDAYKYYYPK
ncbi:hypothetical protein KAW38_05200 [Candidatus Micrarchaeota archaeon]|nr:hypothetical protein [Candidatus Micrarchaeota archaeon]